MASALCVVLVSSARIAFTDGAVRDSGRLRVRLAYGGRVQRRVAEEIADRGAWRKGRKAPVQGGRISDSGTHRRLRQQREVVAYDEVGADDAEHEQAGERERLLAEHLLHVFQPAQQHHSTEPVARLGAADPFVRGAIDCSARAKNLSLIHI